jgi:hypothetical protein
MAKLTQPLGSSEARGKVGGLVYNTWRGISYVRSKVTPEAKEPGLREAMMAYTIAAARRWADLSDAQRTAWYNFSLQHLEPDWTGNDKRLLGYHWYVRINVRTQWHFADWQDAPPDHPCRAGQALPYATAGADYFELSWTWNVPPADPWYYLEIWITPPLSAGRNATIKDARFLTYETLSTCYLFQGGLTPGTYTIFTRQITKQGMIGVFESCRFSIAA